MTKSPKIVLWNMTYGCNYRCDECFQPYDKRRHPPKQVIYKIIKALGKNFDSNTTIKLTGGEIFSIPNFLTDVVPELIKNFKHLKITATTNFSYEPVAYQKFLDTTKDIIDRFSVSWHDQFVSAKDFVNKVIVIRKYMDQIGLKDNWLKTNLILIPNNFEKLKYIKKQLSKHPKIKLHYQYFRIGKFGTKYYKYTKKDKKIIEQLVEDYSAFGYNNKRHLQGHMCNAGITYFVVNPYGDVFPCHEAYEVGEGDDLGSLVDGSFEPLHKPRYCPYEYCSCPIVVIHNIAKTNQGD